MQEKAQELIDFIFGFRKFIVYIILFTVSVIFRIVNLIDGPSFVDLIKNVSIAFFATHGFEHFTTMIRTHLQSKTGDATSQSMPQPIQSEGE